MKSRRFAAIVCVLAIFGLAAFGLGFAPGAAVAASENIESATESTDVPTIGGVFDAFRVVERALAQHLGVKVAELQYAGAQARIVESRASLRPSLTVEARPHWFETSVPDEDAIAEILDIDGFSDLDDIGSGDEFRDELTKRLEALSDMFTDGIPQEKKGGRGHSVTLSGSVPLWRSPLQKALATIADLDAVQADADLENAVGTAIVQSLEAYYGVLRAEAGLKIATLALEEVEMRVADTATKVAQGTATRVDELQVEAERHQAEAVVVQAEGEAAAARMMLNQLLGFGLDARLNVVASDIPAAWPSLDEALVLATGRGDVQRARSDFDQATAGAVIAGEQAKPDVRLFATAEWPEVELALGVDRQGYLGGNATWSQMYLDGERQDDPLADDSSGGPSTWAAGIEVSWPIFDGHRRRAEVAQSELQAQQAALQVEHAEKTAHTEVTAAHARLQAAEQALAGAEQGVIAAQEAVRVANELAAAGAATRGTVLQARLGLAQAEQGHLEATYNFTLAQAAYLQASGVLLEHWLELVGLDGLLELFRVN